MTEQEKKEIVDAVLAAINADSKDYNDTVIEFSSADIPDSELQMVKVPAFDTRSGTRYGNLDLNSLLKGYGTEKVRQYMELAKQYRDEAMSTEIGTVRTELNALKSLIENNGIVGYEA